MLPLEKKFHFICGLPRSGNTVLSSILNQNPEIYVTPTSPLLDQLVENQIHFAKNPGIKALFVPERLNNVTRRIVNAMYEHVPQKIIIDKNRGWCRNLLNAKYIFGYDVKMVVTVRDLPSVMASFLKVFKENPINEMEQALMEKQQPLNDENIVMELWENTVQDCVESIKQAKEEAGDKILFVNYDDLMTDTSKIIHEVEDFLSLPSVKYDFENLINSYVNDDLFCWGIKNNIITNPKIQKNVENPKEILGEKLYDFFSNIGSH